MLHYLKNLGITALALASLHGPALAADDSEWQEAESSSDTAVPAAHALSKELGKRLAAENSKVIFLNVAHCEPGLADEKSWCANFTSSLEQQLIHQGIRFLPEKEKDEIRGKIAEEQVYQQNSMQVNISKAVELGKQKSIQALTSVSVVGDGKGNVKASSSSVNIRDGVVSISESVSLRVKEDTQRSWGVLAKSWGLIGGGLGVASYGLYESNTWQTRASSDYTTYEKATNAGDATAARSKVTKDDNQAAVYQDVAIFGGAVAAFGLYYYLTSREQAFSYRISEAPAGAAGGSQYYALDLAPAISPGVLALNLKLSW